MQGDTERWKYLCELASAEQDPQKLLQLVKEINDLLAQKRQRLDGRNETSAEVANLGAGYAF